MKIENHLLEGAGIEFIASPNHGGKFRDNYLDSIVLHYTAGPLKPTLNTFKNRKGKASAHLVIDRDGTIIQMVPFDTMAWHAGRSLYKGKAGFNKYSIGIEIVNLGYLTKSGSFYHSWLGHVFPPEQVFEGKHKNGGNFKYWHTYTHEQVEAVINVCSLIVDTYNIKEILGHEDISYGRKVDPGPAFPMKKVLSRIFDNDRKTESPLDTPQSGSINVPLLNIREGAGTNYDKVAKPLKNGKDVDILQEKNGWYKVKTEIEGWIMAKYVDAK